MEHSATPPAGLLPTPPMPEAIVNGNEVRSPSTPFRCVAIRLACPPVHGWFAIWSCLEVLHFGFLHMVSVE